MGDQAHASDLVPRIVPTPRWIRAVTGEWKVRDVVVHMSADPETGTLVALDQNGQERNPLRVISLGSKIQEPETREPPTES